jgi:hypothetical protein
MRWNDYDGVFVAFRRPDREHVTLKRWFQIFLYDAGYRISITRNSGIRVWPSEPRWRRVREAEHNRSATMVRKRGEMPS